MCFLFNHITKVYFIHVYTIGKRKLKEKIIIYHIGIECCGGLLTISEATMIGFGNESHENVNRWIILLRASKSTNLLQIKGWERITSLEEIIVYGTLWAFLTLKRLSTNSFIKLKVNGDGVTWIRKFLAFYFFVSFSVRWHLSMRTL